MSPLTAFLVGLFVGAVFGGGAMALFAGSKYGPDAPEGERE